TNEGAHLRKKIKFKKDLFFLKKIKFLLNNLLRRCFIFKRVVKNFGNFNNNELLIPLDQPQCVLHKHELLICGGYEQRACYSYHTLKNEYKGHCVVELINNSNNKDINQITLLSFGGSNKHSLVMKYVNRDHDYFGVRALIGGSNNHLLFITYFYKNISVFDLNTFQFIKHNILPTNYDIGYHCFVSKSKNIQKQEIMKIHKQNYQMLLFCKKTGLSIEYNEDNNTFQFHKLYVCDDIALLYRYSYVCINDIILFFGGSYWKRNYNSVSKSVYKYSIRENKWTTFQNTLPSPLYDCVAILSEDNTHIHIIGRGDKMSIISIHVKTEVREWDPSQLVIICLFIFMKQK
ncbi:hypothetical protein RFI_07604, partial [Reticulomyxa filosa]